MKRNGFQLSYEEELILFYNKYLNTGLWEGYSPILVNMCVKLWNEKESRKVKNLREEDLQRLSFNSKDFASLSNLDRDFLSFYPVINLNITKDYSILMDSLGNIKKFQFKSYVDLAEEKELKENVGRSIFEFLNKFENSSDIQSFQEIAENAILQNILVSKIYKAIYEKLEKEKGIVKASLFALANASIISCDEKLQKMFNYEELFQSKLTYTRSRR